jgi:prepilin-type N-terminal cleavage/methylation domain-containing protein
MRTQPRRFAFTLIELLVVIAIIAILASILFPVFARARENARRASCMSNMKQLGLSMMMYKQDYDGRFPSAGWADNLPCPDGSGNMCGASWEVKIYPYVKSLQVYVCPSDSDRVWLGNNQGTG